MFVVNFWHKRKFWFDFIRNRFTGRTAQAYQTNFLRNLVGFWVHLEHRIIFFCYFWDFLGVVVTVLLSLFCLVCGCACGYGYFYYRTTYSMDISTPFQMPSFAPTPKHSLNYSKFAPSPQVSYSYNSQYDFANIKQEKEVFPLTPATCRASFLVKIQGSFLQVLK